MTATVKTMPPMMAAVREHLQACLICKRRRVVFAGGFRPAPQQQQLWSPIVPPQTAGVRFFALCRKCLKRAKATQMANVDRHFRNELVKERTASVH